MRRETEGCEHDWRVNPFVALATDPPQRQIVCAKCGDVKLERLFTAAPDIHDARTWPKA